MMKPRRGQVWLVRFDPAVGQEIQKTRPAVVMQDDSIGQLALRIIVPVTDWKERYANFPWHTHLSATATNGLEKESSADALQVKSVSEDRFVRLLGSLAEEDLREVAAAIALCVGYAE